MSMLNASQQPQHFIGEDAQGLQASYDDPRPKAEVEADGSGVSANPLIYIGQLELQYAEDASTVHSVGAAQQQQRPGTPTRRGLVANDLLGGLTDLPLRRSLFSDGNRATEQDTSPMEFSNFSVPRANSELRGRRSSCEERSHIDSFGGTGKMSDFCESTPSVIDSYVEHVDSSTEVASEPGTAREAGSGSTCGPTPKPDRPEPSESMPRAPTIAIPEMFETSTNRDIGSIMKFGCIGAEAVKTLERVQDAECWYKLNKQLNHMGNSDARDIKEWQTTGSAAAKLLDTHKLSDFDKANDDDVWASLRRQISSLNKEVAGIAERHADPDEDEELAGARRLQEQIEANDLQGKLARLEVDVQEMVGERCCVKERSISLHEQIQSLEGHVGNVVNIADNYRGENIPFEPKQVGPCEASQKVLDMLQQITDRARLPLLAPRVEEAEQQEFIEPSRVLKNLHEQAAIAHSLAANKPGSGMHSLLSRRPSSSSLAQHLQIGSILQPHQQMLFVPATPRAGSFAGSAASLGPHMIHSNAASVRVPSPLRATPVQSRGSVAARGVSPIRHQVIRQSSAAMEQPAPARGVSPLRQQLHQSAPSSAWAMTPTGLGSLSAGPGSLSASVRGVSPVRTVASLGPNGTLPMSGAASVAAAAAAAAVAAAQQQQHHQAAAAAAAAGSSPHPGIAAHSFGGHPVRPATVMMPAAAAGAMHAAGSPMRPTTKLNL